MLINDFILEMYWSLRTYVHHMVWNISPFWLKSFDEAVHGDVDHVGLAVAPGGALPVLDPPRGREVCALRAVEPYAKAYVKIRFT